MPKDSHGCHIILMILKDSQRSWGILTDSEGFNWIPTEIPMDSEGLWRISQGS